VYCWHHKVLAKQRGDSWQVLRYVTVANVAQMGRERLLEPVPSTLGYWLDVSNRQRQNPGTMPLDLTDAELATAAIACRELAYQEGERAKTLANPTLRGPLEHNARRYAALAHKLESARKRPPAR
jgi:hypothetical protein